MGRGGAVYQSYTALVLLSAFSVASAGLWTVDIDLAPAPSPEDGPPFSAHATRDRALLSYQIIGIVGGYVGSILIVGTLALTVGRRLRTRALNMATRPQEMVKPMVGTFGASPSLSSKWSVIRGKKSTASSLRTIGSNVGSPNSYGKGGFDPVVHEETKQRDNELLGNIYGHVYAHEDRAAAAASYQSPKSPVVAIYPPQGMLTSPVDTMNPARSGLPPPEYDEPSDERGEGRRHVRHVSGGSNRTHASNSTAGPKKLRKRLADIKVGGRVSPRVSSPTQRWAKEDNYDSEMMTPLSASFGERPRTPPTPPTAGTFHSSFYAPTTPGTARSLRFAEPGYIEEEHFNDVRDMPRENPQRVNAYVYNNQAQAVTNVASTRPDPTRAHVHTRSATNVSNDLPLRQQLHEQWPTAPNADGSHSHGVKTTILEAGQRIRKVFTPGTAPLTTSRTLAQPNTPFTGSYYPPGTPVTPVNTTLSSRAEQRQRAREERALHGPIMEEDQVADDTDLWASGY